MRHGNERTIGQSRELKSREETIARLIEIVNDHPDIGISVDDIRQATRTLEEFYNKREKRNRIVQIYSDPESLVLVLFSIVRFRESPRKILTSLNSTYEAKGISIREGTGFAVKPAVLEHMLRQAYPGNPKEDLRELVGSNSEDGICYLGETFLDFGNLFHDACEAQNIPRKERVVPVGIAIPTYKTFVTYRKAPQATRIHEKTHIDNAGLHIGIFGDAVDEGMTQYLTLKKLGKDKNLMALTFTTYAGEVQLIRKLMSTSAEVSDALMDRYQNGSGNTLDFLEVLMKTFGWQTCHDIFRAHSHRQLHDDDNPFISTKAAIKLLSSK